MQTERYVPLEKQSKKRRREHFSTLRNEWNGITPVTKVIQNKKRPNRKREKALLKVEF